MSDRDPQYMRRALRLAALGRHASPNPMVGCVIVAPNGAIAGEGWHVAPGSPHAEANALAAAGSLARGSTAYVTLEPCAHTGRTPPCADALVAAEVARVVVAMTDPDERVSGKGLEGLRRAGIEVSVGECGAQAQALNAAYIKHRTTGVPWVIIKSAMSLDGKIATRTGDSRWITSAVSRKAAHRQLRDRCDAILTGAGTILADDPQLTTRLVRRAGRNPWRIVADSLCRIPLSSRVVQQSLQDSRTIVATTNAAPAAARAALSEHGCTVLVCDAEGDGRVSMADLICRLGTRRDIVSVLVESGGELASSFLMGGLADRWLCYIAPIVLGGAGAPGPVGGSGAAKVADGRRMRICIVRRSGPDLVVDSRFG